MSSEVLSRITKFAACNNDIGLRQESNSQYPTAYFRILIISVVVLLFSSCVDNASIDFTESWIKYYKYDSDLDSNGQIISKDTIFVSMNDDFIIRIKTQSNNDTAPSIFKRLDDNELIDITNLPNEASLESNYRENNGYRQINKIYVDINESVCSSGQLIQYKTTIGSIDGEIEDEIVLKIQP